MFFTSHSALSLAMPSSGSSVVPYALTTSSGIGLAGRPVRAGRGAGVEDDAVDLVGRYAGVLDRLAHGVDGPGADGVLGGAVPAARSSAECPIPTAATLPRPDQTPRPSSIRYIEAGASGVSMLALLLQLSLISPGDSSLLVVACDHPIRRDATQSTWQLFGGGGSARCRACAPMGCARGSPRSGRRRAP